MNSIIYAIIDPPFILLHYPVKLHIEFIREI